MDPVTDPADIRVLIPRVRRAIDGPMATGSASPSTTLSDEQVANVVADAIAEVIFYSSGAFPKKLEVTARDPNYLAPIAWRTSEPLSEEEGSVIVAEAALDCYFHSLSDLKTAETHREGDREWSWNVSATAIAERVKDLREQRDRAIALLTAQNVLAERWVNTLEVKDAYTDLLIEPFLSTGGYLPSGQEFMPPLGP